MPYSIQQFVREDGSPIVGPDGRPLFFPHFQIPAWVVFDDQVDARALGTFAFLQVFVDQSEGELSSSITAADIATRFGVSEETVTRAGNSRNPPGLVPRLAQARALVVGPNAVKTRDCQECGAEMLRPCPSSCTSRKGRRRVKPRFELATDPPGRFEYQGPINRWEYYTPKRIAKRLSQEGPQSSVPPEDRREVVPFAQVLAWPVLDRSIGLIELGAYVFLAAHTSLAEGMMSTGENLFRNAIARRFGWSENHVSKVTGTLERLKLIGKTGLVRGQEHRYGHTSEPTSYVVRVKPPAQMMHPYPIRVSEYRDADRISARQEAASSLSLRFPRVPSDLRIVDNSDCPQVSTRENEGLWTGKSEAVDEFPMDLGTHPHTHPRTHPSPSAQQPQPQGGAEPLVGGGADGVGFSRGGGSGQADGPPAAAVADPLWPLVERNVPAGLCRNGRQDQLKILTLLQHLRVSGYSDDRLRLVFHRVGSDSVVNPWAVVYSRVSSRSRLERHLGVLDGIEADRREREQRSTVPPRCSRHGLQVMPELCRPGVPRCVRCAQEDQEMFGSPVGKETATTDGKGSEAIQEKPSSAGQPLSEARQAAHGRTALMEITSQAMGPASPVRPGAAFQDLEPVLQAHWTVEHCGRCISEGRYLICEVSPEEYARVACHTCHR